MIADQAVTPAKQSQPLTQGSSVATTTGTTVDVNLAIPSWAKRITIALSGVSLSGSANTVVQLGSGSFTTTGYTSTSVYAASANQAGAQSATNGLCVYGGSLTNAFTGLVTLINVGSNTWIEGHSGMLNSTVGVTGGGSITLGGVLDRIRLATSNGTDTFDAGSVNILYE